jgi:hypothetical protein
MRDARSVHSLTRWNLVKAGAEDVSRVAISLVQFLYPHAGNDHIDHYLTRNLSFTLVNSLLNNWSYSGIVPERNK